MEVWNSNDDPVDEVVHTLSDRDAKVWVYFMITVVVLLVIAVTV
tara:strand:+ start:874 stop:1005 length:132 start_codon:yes stop_codon:yes gene_type:complete